LCPYKGNWLEGTRDIKDREVDVSFNSTFNSQISLTDMH